MPAHENYKFLNYARRAASAIGIAVLAGVLWATTGNFSTGSDEKAMQQLEDAVRRAAVSCYAAEGRYPDRLDYLSEKYGLQLDGRFCVHYEVFASNLAPDITVVTVPTEEEMWGIK